MIFRGDFCECCICDIRKVGWVWCGKIWFSAASRCPNMAPSKEVGIGWFLWCRPYAIAGIGATGHGCQGVKDEICLRCLMPHYRKWCRWWWTNSLNIWLWWWWRSTGWSKKTVTCNFLIDRYQGSFMSSATWWAAICRAAANSLSALLRNPKNRAKLKSLSFCV